MTLYKSGLYVMAVLYVVLGANHFIHPAGYLRIMPPYIPWHRAMVIMSGIFEIGLGLLLLPPATRRLAASGIIILLIAVFPANVQMAIDWQKEQHPNLWIAYARLPLQLLLIRWAYTYTRR